MKPGLGQTFLGIIECHPSIMNPAECVEWHIEKENQFFQCTVVIIVAIFIGQNIKASLK